MKIYSLLRPKLVKFRPQMPNFDELDRRICQTCQTLPNVSQTLTNTILSLFLLHLPSRGRVRREILLLLLLLILLNVVKKGMLLLNLEGGTIERKQYTYEEKEHFFFFSFSFSFSFSFLLLLILLLIW